MTCQVAEDSSQTAEVTLVLNRMWRRRSNLSTTWLKYRSFSAWPAKCSVHSHSLNSSSEKKYP